MACLQQNIEVAHATVPKQRYVCSTLDFSSASRSLEGLAEEGRSLLPISCTLAFNLSRSRSASRFRCKRSGLGALGSLAGVHGATRLPFLGSTGKALGCISCSLLRGPKGPETLENQQLFYCFGPGGPLNAQQSLVFERFGATRASKR